MSMNALQAIQAYSKALEGAAEGASNGVDKIGRQDGPSFGDVLKDVVQDVVETTKGGEETTVKAMAGEAEIVDVVAAITAAEVTVETVVAVRDKVITAYQEIMRMPI